MLSSMQINMVTKHTQFNPLFFDNLSGNTSFLSDKHDIWPDKCLMTDCYNCLGFYSLYYVDIGYPQIAMYVYFYMQDMHCTTISINYKIKLASYVPY